MTVDDVPGRITICRRGRSAVSADDAGVTVNDSRGRTRLFPWPEITGFADGRKARGENLPHWVLDVVLRSGQTYSVDCTHAESAAPETLTAVLQVAERYGVPADVTGIMMASDGRPPYSDRLYEDPGGQDGVRYWDGSCWSPLLSPMPQQGVYVHKSAPHWVDLPAAPEPWDYPAVKASGAMAWLRRGAALTAVGLLAGTVTRLWSGDWNAAGVFFALAGIAAVLVLPPAGAIWWGWHQLEVRAKASIRPI